MQSNPSKIVVMGGFNVDLMARAPYLPINGETVSCSTFNIGPGEKWGIKAVTAKLAGSAVTMITKIAKDEFADIALKSSNAEGIEITHVFQDEQHPTGSALIMVDEKTRQNKILVVIGANVHITPKDVESTRANIETAKIHLV